MHSAPLCQLLQTILTGKRKCPLQFSVQQVCHLGEHFISVAQSLTRVQTPDWHAMRDGLLRHLHTLGLSQSKRNLSV